MPFNSSHTESFSSSSHASPYSIEENEASQRLSASSAALHRPVNDDDDIPNQFKPPNKAMATILDRFPDPSTNQLVLANLAQREFNKFDLKHSGVVTTADLSDILLDDKRSEKERTDAALLYRRSMFTEHGNVFHREDLDNWMDTVKLSSDRIAQNWSLFKNSAIGTGIGVLTGTSSVGLAKFLALSEEVPAVRGAALVAGALGIIGGGLGYLSGRRDINNARTDVAKWAHPNANLSVDPDLLFTPKV